MGQNFNLKRVLLLSKLSFLNNSLLKVFGGIFTALFIFSLFVSISPIGSSNMHAGNVILSFIYLAMIGLIATLNYDQYSQKLKVNTTHTLPATLPEKFFTPFFVSFILIAVLSSILYLAWAFFTLVINDVQFSYADVTSAFNLFHVLALITNILFIHSLCCLFSILFKGGTIMICFFISVIYPVGIRTIISFMDAEFLSFSFAMLQYYWALSKPIMTIIFWTISYFMFKKRELNK